MGGFAGLALCASTQAIVPSRSISRYDKIPARNLFGLKQPEPPMQPTNPPVPLPKLTLTGITTILGKKLALLKEQPLAAKPGAPANELSLILAQGQREGDVEALRIDENSGSVQVNNSGTPMTLTFEKDGAKTQPAAAPAALPSANPGSVPPGFPQQVPARANPTPGMRPLPSRNVPFPQPAANPYSVPGPTGTPGFGSTTPTVPPTPPTAAALPPDLTPEEQTIVLELRRQAEKNNAQLPTLTPNNPAAPPTPFTTSNGLLPGASVPANTTPLLPQ
jgi:hypothetical protein